MGLHCRDCSNFEGLTELAADLRSDPLLAGLVRYCELREQGLRADAFAVLERFITDALSCDDQVQRALVLRILKAQARMAEVHQFLSYPLRRRLVEHVLANWSEADPRDTIPVVELALLRQDPPLLDRALQMCPSDDRVRACLVSYLVERVDFATHHLNESKFLGSVADAVASLDQAEHHISNAVDPSGMIRLSERVAELRALLSNWTDYQRSPEGTFPEWCQARGHKHGWWNVYYYER